MKQQSKLYKLEFTARNNQNISTKTEYLRCESKEMLVNAANQWMMSSHSHYYGYSKVEVSLADNFAEVLSIDLDIDEKVSFNQNKINMLSEKITGYKKIIAELNSEINNIRQDNKCTKDVCDEFCATKRYQCKNHYLCTVCGKIHYTDYLLATIKRGEIPESWKREEFKHKPSKNNQQKLADKIKKCMVQDNDDGGRTNLEINPTDIEEMMYLATGQYHNRKCPVNNCSRLVSCVCTSKCNHIWYCPEHILHHDHRRELTY